MSTTMASSSMRSGARALPAPRFAQTRQEGASSRMEILKWMIGLWAVNLSATVGIIAFMLRHP
ncbi:MAG: hypothetical protein DMF87_13900 [Acidobacteria bacterium]|nr:MAG: hypothetical protein DMF87_13900 [Acidobacteriota bacterium]